MTTEEMFESLENERLLKEAYEKLQQNKHGKKIDIAEIAIKKIPLVAYPGFSTEQNLKIHETAENVLKLSKEKNNGNEVCAVINMNSADMETAYVLGDPDSTNVRSDPDASMILSDASSVVVNIHNHPRGTIFSIYDTLFALYEERVELMVLLSNQGNLSWLRKNKTFDRQKAYDILKKCIKEDAPRAMYKKDGKEILNTKKMTQTEMISVSKKFLKQSIKCGFEYRIGQNDYEKTKDDDNPVPKRRNPHKSIKNAHMANTESDKQETGLSYG